MSPNYSEAQVESQVRDLFIRAGWYSELKTDAAMIARGSGRRRGHIETGFPDRVFLLGCGLGVCLAAVIELKTDTGRLSPEQVDMHHHLRETYGIHPHLIRTPEDATPILALGRQIRKALKEMA